LKHISKFAATKIKQFSHIKQTVLEINAKKLYN